MGTMAWYLGATLTRPARTHAFKRHLQACDSPKCGKQTTLTNDPDGWEFRLTFQMNPDYGVYIRDEIESTAKC
jgi:hypothetical protein